MRFIRFRKSIRVVPGVRLNLNKRSAGVTLGGRGGKVTVNSRGGRTTSFRLPGGFSVSRRRRR